MKSPEEMRIRIAEVCPFVVKDSPLADYVWVRNNETVLFSPLTDLNAMHEAEMFLVGLGDGTSCEFCRLLDWVCSRDWRSGAAKTRKPEHATAAQRAEAFCRTIDGTEGLK